MSISKRLKAAGHKGPHPLASWADDPRAGAAVGNLGLLDNPEANRRIADRLLRGPIADRPAKGVPDPGCIRADDPEFAELVREHGLPSPAAITPEGAWYRLGSSFYRIGEGPFPKYLHPTGQIGEPWRPELPAAAAESTAEASPAKDDQVVVEQPTARKARKGRKKVHWQDVSLPEILPDWPPSGVSNVDIIEKVATHLELLEDQCPTVGDLALIWFSEREQPHTLEAMTSLTEDERETLRQALAEFRRRQGWDARIGMPDGFPLAWIRPEPTADIVIDPMAAAKPKLDQVEPQVIPEPVVSIPDPPASMPAETDVIRGRVKASYRRGRKSAVGQMVFFAANDSDWIDREEASCR